MSQMLFEPFDLSGLLLPNRVVMPPMTRTRSSRTSVNRHDGHVLYDQRTDEYGGTLSNRLRSLDEGARAVIAIWGLDRVGVRFPP